MEQWTRLRHYLIQGGRKQGVTPSQMRRLLRKFRRNVLGSAEPGKR